MLFYSYIFAGTATFPQHAISMWKDPIFSITLVYYSLKLYDYIISDGKIEEKEGFIGLNSLYRC